MSEQLCGCGCGNPAPIAKRNRYKNGVLVVIKGSPHLCIHGHNARASHVRTITQGGYVFKRTPEGAVRPHRWTPEHILIAEAALGKPLPKGAQVHHVNGNRSDNRPQNLVVCQDQELHHLLHRRQRALRKCGHAGWMSCAYCGVWDDPARMYVRPNGRKAHHRECAKLYRAIGPDVRRAV